MDSEDFEAVPASDLLPASVSPVQLLRMKHIMANQCFEMNIKVNMNKLESSETLEAAADLSKYEEEIEQARSAHFNKTLALNRMQVWNAIIDKLIQDKSGSASLKALVDENAEISEKAMKVLKETRELQDQITDIRKERLEIKGLIKNKMQEINTLKQMGENQGKAQKQAVQRAEEILQKYKKMASISQNVLRGIILGSRVNWFVDPKLRDIVMGLESIPEMD